MASRVTIQDVATLARVSKVTVSYVLNGRAVEARISNETQERVLAAANALGYRPSAIARMLVTQKSMTIAVVFQYAQFFSTWSSFISDAMHGVCAAAVRHDYDLMMHTRVSHDVDDEVRQLCDGRVDGALILRDADDPLSSELAKRSFPHVLFFTRSSIPGVPFVDADNYSGGRLAAKIDLGHKRIAMVRGSAHSVSSSDRYNGYRDALETAGMRLRPEHVVCVHSPTDRMDDVLHMLRSPEAPTAIFVWSDDVAYQVMRLCHQQGIRIPDDLSIVGFDSLEQSNISSPPLTSVRQPIVDMARDATELLVHLMSGQSPTRTQLVYPLTLDIRSSTAAPHREPL